MLLELMLLFTVGAAVPDGLFAGLDANLSFLFMCTLSSPPHTLKSQVMSSPSLIYICLPYSKMFSQCWQLKSRWLGKSSAEMCFAFSLIEPTGLHSICASEHRPLVTLHFPWSKGEVCPAQDGWISWVDLAQDPYVAHILRSLTGHLLGLDCFLTCIETK